MIPELPIFSDLFWLFFGFATSILMLSIAVAFRNLRTAASRGLLVAAIMDLPCATFTTCFWNVWPYGFLGDGGFSTTDTTDLESAFETIEPVFSNLSTLLFLIWMVCLLFVALRWRQEHKRLHELQHILEQKIHSVPPSNEAP